MTVDFRYVPLGSNLTINNYLLNSESDFKENLNKIVLNYVTKSN